MYNLKYLKYKNKYLELKHNINNCIIGGALGSSYVETDNLITTANFKCLWLFFSKLIYHAVVLYNIFSHKSYFHNNIENFIIYDEHYIIFKNLIDINFNIDFSLHDKYFKEENKYLIMSGLDIIFNPIGKQFNNTDNPLYTIYYGKDIHESIYHDICNSLNIMLHSLWDMYGK